MPSNSFIIPGEITTITFLSGQPIDGVGKYGPYRSYQVRTEQNEDKMFYPPRYLYDELAALDLTRGSVVKLLGTPSETRDGRKYLRIEILGTAAPREIQPPATRDETTDPRNGILASVALKAATQTRNIAEPEEVLKVAADYLEWLKRA